MRVFNKLFVFCCYYCIVNAQSPMFNFNNFLFNFDFNQERKYYLKSLQKNTVHVLDSTLEWLYDIQSSTYKPTFKNIITSRTPGAPELYRTRESKKYIELSHQWRPWIFEQVEYFQPVNDGVIKTVFAKPWNSDLQLWDDTLFYTNYTGFRNNMFDIDLVTKYIIRDYDFVTNQFTFGQKIILTILSDTLPTELRAYIFDPISNGYKNYKKLTAIYNSENIPIQTIEQDYDENIQQYVNVLRSLIQYYANYKKYIELQQTWNGTQWINHKKTTYFYNQNTLLEEEIIELWNNNLQTWEYDTRKTYNYTSFGKIAVEAKYVWVNGWRPDMKEEYEYDMTGNLVQYTMFTNNGSNFVPFSRLIYQYDSEGNLLEIFEQSWNGTVFDNSHRQSYIYYNDLLSAVVYYYWHSGLLSWFFYYKIEYTYNYLYNVVTLMEDFNYDELQSTWIPNQRTQYFYSDLDVTNILGYSEDDIKCFPNPAKNTLCIFISSPEKFCNIKITDMKGQIVYNTSSLQNINRIDVSSFPAGNYSIVIERKLGPNVHRKILIVK